MAEETKATFIGSDKIVTVTPLDQKTPMGSEMLHVAYESGRKKVMTKKTYELLVTDVPSDASIARKTKFNAMVPAVIAVMCEYDIDVSEIQAFLTEVAGSIDNSFARATNFVWTHDDMQYIPNSNPLYDRSLLEADALLKSIPEVVEAPKPPENAADTTTTAE